MDAALAFLWTHPFRELTVQGLMSELPVSRSAFYQYFDDLHDLMHSLLGELEAEILAAANPWLAGDPDRVSSLKVALAGLVRVCHARGPLLRATAEAAVGDARLERSWNALLARFDEAVAACIEEDQRTGLVAAFDAQAIAVALNRLDAHLLIHAFGKVPQQAPARVLETLTHIWISTLYGAPSADGSHDSAR